MDPSIVVTPASDDPPQRKSKAGRKVTIKTPRSLSRKSSKEKLQLDTRTSPLSPSSEPSPQPHKQPELFFPQAAQKQQDQQQQSRRKKSVFEPKPGSQDNIADSQLPAWQQEERRRALVNLSELRELFRLIDVNADKTLSNRDLSISLKKVGMESSEGELVNLFTELELMDMANGIDWELFQRVFITCASEPPGSTKETSRKEIMKSFAIFEKRNDSETVDSAVKPGKILVRDFYKMLTETCNEQKRMTKEEASDLLTQIAPQLKMDDYFDYKAYVNQMFS